MNEYTALASRIRESLNEIEIVVNRVEHLHAKALDTGDNDFWDGVALNLHGFYTGIEQIFEDIGRTVDQSISEGAQWHRDLLLQMSAALSNIRPAVIMRDTRHCLDDFRGFRHVVRNVYTFNLHPPRLKELVKQLRPCYKAVHENLSEFAKVLEKIDSDTHAL